MKVFKKNDSFKYDLSVSDLSNLINSKIIRRIE
jgi:hypothetical protein